MVTHKTVNSLTKYYIIKNFYKNMLFFTIYINYLQKVEF